MHEGVPVSATGERTSRVRGRRRATQEHDPSRPEVPMNRPLLPTVGLALVAVAFFGAGAALLVFGLGGLMTAGFWTRVLLSALGSWLVACGMTVVATRSEELAGPTLRSRTS